jgi:hypothetical protein
MPLSWSSGAPIGVARRFAVDQRKCEKRNLDFDCRRADSESGHISQIRGTAKGKMFDSPRAGAVGGLLLWHD